jgi:hypothetical protein
MDDKTKGYLPAEVKKFTPALLEKLTELAVPPQFRGTTSLAEVQDARRLFENENAGATFSELHDKYCRCIDKIMAERLNAYKNKEPSADQSPVPVEPKDPKALAEQKRSLQTVLERNSVEAYRKDHGLDELRENLKKKLVENISYEKGLANLLRYYENNKGRMPMKPIITHPEIEKLNVPPEVKMINSVYPNLTADEVSWLSLADIPKDWLYNKPAYVYYPHALVDIDMDGLKFAMGTIDDRLETGSEASNSFDAGGLTNASHQYQLVPFNHNVAQLIRGIVLLSIDDQDLFGGLWARNNLVPMQRGDSMLLKSFLKNRAERYSLPENFDSATLESLVGDRKISDEAIGECREAITRYYSGMQVRKMPLHWVQDFVKLMGMLSRLPKFVEKEDLFRGYAKMYGSGIDFISEDGRIVDSVPFAGHLQHSASYAFQSAIASPDRKNVVMQELLKELQMRVSNVNVGKNQLAADAVQSEIFEKHGVYVPTGVYSGSHKYDPVEMYLSKSTDDELVTRTVKFSLDELRIIRDLLGCMPKGAAGNVRAIYKEISDAQTIDTFRTGTVKSGHYDPVKKRIAIALPIESPVISSGEELLMAEIREDKKQKSQLEKNMENVLCHMECFRHCLLHETGESIYAHLPDDEKRKWLEITALPEKSAAKKFLTPYSKEAVNEDFAECFAVYLTHGAEFRKRADAAPIIREKYEFMKRVWCADRQREFNDASLLSLSKMHGKPDDDLNKLSAEEISQRVMRSQNTSLVERMIFANTALSYEQLAEQAEKDGVSTISGLEKAARKHDASKAAEALEEMSRTQRVRAFVNAKTEKEVYGLKADVETVLDTNFHELLCHGQRAEALECLLKHGAKPRKAEKVVDDLLKLYKYFEEYLAIPEITDKEVKDTGDRVIGFVKGVIDWDKQKKSRRSELPPGEEEQQ